MTFRRTQVSHNDNLHKSRELFVIFAFAFTGAWSAELQMNTCGQRFQWIYFCWHWLSFDLFPSNTLRAIWWSTLSHLPFEFHKVAIRSSKTNAFIVLIRRWVQVKWVLALSLYVNLSVKYTYRVVCFVVRTIQYPAKIRYNSVSATWVR